MKKIEIKKNSSTEENVSQRTITFDIYTDGYYTTSFEDINDAQDYKEEQEFMAAKVNSIAKAYLRIDTLETQNNDSDDFKENSVWSIEAALEAAYQAGKEAGRNN